MAVFNDHLRDLLNLVVKNVLGREHTSDIPINLENAYLPYNQITPFDCMEDSGLNNLEYTSGLRKPSSVSPEKNLFNFYINLSSEAQGRIATIYGIEEVSYSDVSGSDTGYVADNYQFIHRTFDLPDQGVVAGDVLFLPLTGKFYVSDLVITGDPPNTGLQFPANTFVEPPFTFGNDIDALILKRNAVQLFTVTGSNTIVGREQTFFMVDPLSDAFENPSPYIADLNLLASDRLRPLVPHRKNTIVDSMFTKNVQDLKEDWDFMVVLYPDNGSGQPDYTKPILNAPVIDSTKLLDEQGMVIDHKNGSIHFTVPPRLGDAINPNSVVGQPLKLWAIFAIVSMDTGVSDSDKKSGSIVKGISDFDPSSASEQTSLPSYFQYDSSRKIWSLFSGREYLDMDPDNKPKQGFEIGGLDQGMDVSPGLVLKNNRWEFTSVASNNSDSLPIWFQSGKSGDFSPGFGVSTNDYQGGFTFNSVVGKWQIDNDFHVSSFNTTQSKDLGVKIDRFTMIGDYLFTLSDIYTDNAVLRSFDISSSVVFLESFDVSNAHDIISDGAGTVWVCNSTEERIYFLSGSDLEFFASNTRDDTYLDSYLAYDSGLLSVSGIRKTGSDYFYDLKLRNISSGIDGGDWDFTVETSGVTLGSAGKIDIEMIGVSTDGYTHIWYPFHNRVYHKKLYHYYDGDSWDVSTHDVSDFASINASVCYYDSTSTYLFVLSTGDTLQIWDLSGPTMIGSHSTDMDDPVGLVVNDDKAYVLNRNNSSLLVLDVTLPASISVLDKGFIASPIRSEVKVAGSSMAIAHNDVEFTILSFVDPIFDLKNIGVETITATRGVFSGSATKAPVRLTPLASAPTDPQEGDIYSNGVGDSVHIYLGGIWKTFTLA